MFKKITGFQTSTNTGDEISEIKKAILEILNNIHEQLSKDIYNFTEVNLASLVSLEKRINVFKGKKGDGLDKYKEEKLTNLVLLLTKRTDIKLEKKKEEDFLYYIAEFRLFIQNNKDRIDRLEDTKKEIDNIKKSLDIKIISESINKIQNILCGKKIFQTIPKITDDTYKAQIDKIKYFANECDKIDEEMKENTRQIIEECNKIIEKHKAEVDSYIELLKEKATDANILTINDVIKENNEKLKELTDKFNADVDKLQQDISIIGTRLNKLKEIFKIVDDIRDQKNIVLRDIENAKADIKKMKEINETVTYLQDKKGIFTWGLSIIEKIIDKIIKLNDDIQTNEKFKECFSKGREKLKSEKHEIIMEVFGDKNIDQVNIDIKNIIIDEYSLYLQKYTGYMTFCEIYKYTDIDFEYKVVDFNKNYETYETYYKEIYDELKEYIDSRGEFNKKIADLIDDIDNIYILCYHIDLEGAFDPITTLYIIHHESFQKNNTSNFTELYEKFKSNPLYDVIFSPYTTNEERLDIKTTYLLNEYTQHVSGNNDQSYIEQMYLQAYKKFEDYLEELNELINAYKEPEEEKLQDDALKLLALIEMLIDNENLYTALKQDYLEFNFIINDDYNNNFLQCLWALKNLIFLHDYTLIGTDIKPEERIKIIKKKKNLNFFTKSAPKFVNGDDIELHNIFEEFSQRLREHLKQFKNVPREALYTLHQVDDNKIVKEMFTVKVVAGDENLTLQGLVNKGNNITPAIKEIDITNYPLENIVFVVERDGPRELTCDKNLKINGIDYELKGFIFKQNNEYKYYKRSDGDKWSSIDNEFKYANDTNNALNRINLGYMYYYKKVQVAVQVPDPVLNFPSIVLPPKVKGGITYNYYDISALVQMLLDNSDLYTFLIDDNKREHFDTYIDKDTLNKIEALSSIFKQHNKKKK